MNELNSETNKTFDTSNETKILQEELKEKLRQSRLRDENAIISDYVVKQSLNRAKIDKDRQPIIEYLQGMYPFYCDSNDPNLTLYVWLENVWKPNAEALFLKELVSINSFEKTKVTVLELMDYFKGFGQNTKIEPKPPNLIAYKNGLYDLETSKIIDHDPKYFVVNMIPHDYDIDAKCPNWERFQSEIHVKEDMAFIQEWYGYQFYTGYPIKGFVILQGYGNNGKTVELETIENILGYDNITNTTLQQLTYSEYHSSELYHKLSDMADDITNQKIRLVGNINIASDGGRIHTRQIYGKPFDFQNYAKITNSCNEPPIIIEDEIDATWNRLNFVEYPFIFKTNPDASKGEKQAIDKEILLKMFADEGQGIINWMIEGLKRLRKNKWKFSKNRSTEETKKLYRIRSNPIVCFNEEVFIYTGNDDEDYVFKEDVYPAFRKFCESKKLKSIPTQDKLFKTLRDLGIEASRPRLFDQKRVYLGYKLNITESMSQRTIQAQDFKHSISEYNTHNNDSVDNGYDLKVDSVTQEAFPVCISCKDYASCEKKSKDGCNSFRA